MGKGDIGYEEGRSKIIERGIGGKYYIAHILTSMVFYIPHNPASKCGHVRFEVL